MSKKTSKNKVSLSKKKQGQKIIMEQIMSFGSVRNQSSFNVENDKIFEIMKKMQFQSANTVNNASLEEVCKNLSNIYSKFHPLDVFKSIVISETWLPNLSSFIKFSWALEVFFSMKEYQFHNVRIDSYEIYKDFIVSIHEILPHNPMLEDFHPVKDWGVKYQKGINTYNIFFGSHGFSDITSYIESFLISYSNSEQAVKDVMNVLNIQNYLINSINKNEFGEFEEFTHKIYIPSYNFWIAMNDWFSDFKIQNDNKKLTIELGRVNNRIENFYDRFQEGNANPYCFFSYSDRLYPFSMRNLTTVLVDFYSKYKKIEKDSSIKNISNFIKRSIPDSITDNFVIRNNNKIAPYIFSGIFISSGQYNFILPVFIGKDDIVSIEKELREIISGNNWGMQRLDNNDAMQLRYKNDDLLKYEDINIVCVIQNLTTQEIFIPGVGETHFKLFSLPNFISVIDSLESTDDFTKYINFVELNQKKNSLMTFDIDGFAIFKDSCGLVEDGAIDYSRMSFDAHWGMSWKYKHLEKLYRDLPDRLPLEPKKWQVRSSYEGNFCLVSKDHEAVSWSTKISNTDIHFVFKFIRITKDMHELNARVLELCAEALSDSFSQRKELLPFDVFSPIENITFDLDVGQMIYSDNLDEIILDNHNGFLCHCDVKINKNNLLKIKIYLDLQYCFYYLSQGGSASFQTEICQEVIQSISSVLNINEVEDILTTLDSSKSWPLRMTMGYLKTNFDIVRENSLNPLDLHYKLARQKLAYILKEYCIEPGVYSDISRAKEIINLLADKFRENVHRELKKINRKALDYQINFGTLEK